MAERIYYTLREEALPSLTSATQIFANAPIDTTGIILTVRGGSFTYTTDGATVPTAGGVGNDFNKVESWCIPIRQTEALLWRAIANSGTPTGYITYIKATADTINALVSANMPRDLAADALTTVTTSSAINVNTETYLYKHITTAAPTNYSCKTGSGKLHTIAVNKHTDAAVLTIYDGTDATGAVIAVLTLTTAAAGTPVGNTTRIYDVGFNDGLFIVASGAAADFTVSYK